MKRISIVSAVVIFCLATQVVQGQDTLQALSFKEAVKIGLDNNLTLNQQENLLVSSKVNKTAGLLNLGPSVNLNATASRTDGNRFIQQEARTVNGVADYFGASLDAQMPLFAGLGNMKAYQAASSQYEAQLHFVQRTSQDVIRDVSRQFLTCLLDQQLVRIAQQNLETQLKTHEQIAAQVEAGSKAEVDLKNQDYLVKNAELLLIRAKNTLSNDKITMFQTLQLDPQNNTILEEPDWTAISLDSVTLGEMQAIAAERRSDLKRAEENEKAAKFGFQAAKGYYYPYIGLFASYGSSYNYVYRNDILPHPVNRSFDNQFFNDYTQLNYGLRMTIPIFNNFQYKNTAVRNKMLYQNAELQKRSTEITIKGEVMQAYQNFNDAKSAFNAAEAQMAAAEESYNLEKERYDLGISDIVALSVVAQSRTKAQGDFQSAKYTLMFQQLLINYATGVLKFEDIP